MNSSIACCCGEGGSPVCHVHIDSWGRIRRWPMVDLVVKTALGNESVSLQLSIDNIDMTAAGGPADYDFATLDADGTILNSSSTSPVWSNNSSPITRSESGWSFKYEVQITGAEIDAADTDDDIEAQGFNGYQWSAAVTFRKTDGTLIATYTTELQGSITQMGGNSPGSRAWYASGQTCIDPILREVVWTKGEETTDGTFGMRLRTSCYCSSRDSSSRGHGHAFGYHLRGETVNWPIVGLDPVFAPVADESLSYAVDYNSNLVVIIGVTGTWSQIAGTHTLKPIDPDTYQPLYANPDHNVEEGGMRNWLQWGKEVIVPATSRLRIKCSFAAGFSGGFNRVLEAQYATWDGSDWVNVETLSFTDLKLNGNWVTLGGGDGAELCPQEASVYNLTEITSAGVGQWYAQEADGAWGNNNNYLGGGLDAQCVDQAVATYGGSEPSGISINIGDPTKLIGYPFDLPDAIRVTLAGGNDDGYEAVFVRGGENFDVVGNPDDDSSGYFSMRYYSFDDEGAEIWPIFNQHDGPNDTDPDQEITKPISYWSMSGGALVGTYRVCPAGGNDPFIRTSPAPLLASEGVDDVEGEYLNPADGGPLMLEWEEVANPYA